MVIVFESGILQQMERMVTVLQKFTFSGRITDSNGVAVTLDSTPTITTVAKSQNGGNIESINSVKYFSPLLYSSQNRAVTARDYEAIIKKIYPNTESVSVIGGEELNPPEFGTVAISIKPKNGDLVSDFSKNQILSKLKQYSISGINQKNRRFKNYYMLNLTQMFITMILVFQHQIH